MKTRILIIIIAGLPFINACNQKNTAMEDRIEIQDLINAYSHCADMRQAHQQAELFTENAVVKSFNGKDTIAIQTVQGRKALEEAFHVLQQYDVTTHFNGQSIIKINGDTATGEVYCLAHHIKNAEKSLLIMSIRYHDTYVKQKGKWFFSERDLYIDWTDKREISN